MLLFDECAREVAEQGDLEQAAFLRMEAADEQAAEGMLGVVDGTPENWQREPIRSGSLVCPPGKSVTLTEAAGLRQKS